MSSTPRSAERKSVAIDPVSFTPHFSWKINRHAGKATEEIWCERVSLRAAAERYDTPLYLYSRAAIHAAFQELRRGLGTLPHTLCFAMKSNGNLAILKYLAGLGSGFDIVSGGELEHLRRIGVSGDRVVFSGVGKKREEIRAALQYSGKRNTRSGILLFNVESEAELDVLLEESARHIAKGGSPPGAAVRVNPDVQAGGHPHISTGRHEHKFGLDWIAARRLYLTHQNSRYLRWQGISAHIGSQIISPQPFRHALRRIIGYIKELRSHGLSIRYLDFGGGLGVRYTTEKSASRTTYARMISKMVAPLGLHLLLEPGRAIIGPAGVLLTRVIYTKENRGKNFVIVDAGMNDLLRPALYGAVHPITAVARSPVPKKNNVQRADIVGPVCETGDCFLHDWPLGPVKAGDVLAIWTAGAYGMSLASNYNARCRPPEILINGAAARLIRRRETQKDLLRMDCGD